MKHSFADQVFKVIDFDKEHAAMIFEIDHMVETFKVSDRDFDNLVSATIGELFVFNDDPLMSNLTKAQAQSVYEALRTTYG